MSTFSSTTLSLLYIRCTGLFYSKEYLLGQQSVGAIFSGFKRFGNVLLRLRVFGTEYFKKTVIEVVRMHINVDVEGFRLLGV